MARTNVPYVEQNRRRRRGGVSGAEGRLVNDLTWLLVFRFTGAFASLDAACYSDALVRF